MDGTVYSAMSYETGKATARRLHDIRFATRYLIGDGIDIGSGTDPLSNYGRLFPGIRSIRLWDKPDGDAQFLRGVPNETFDFVHSSHCLEHMVDPEEAMQNWVRVTKPGGHLIIVVPDFRLYEHGEWPSKFNADHKWHFSINGRTGQPGHISLTGLFRNKWLIRHVSVLKLELLDAGFSYSGLEGFDQSALTACEPAIEIILQKHRLDE